MDSSVLQGSFCSGARPLLPRASREPFNLHQDPQQVEENTSVGGKDQSRQKGRNQPGEKHGGSEHDGEKIQDDLGDVQPHQDRRDDSPPFPFPDPRDRSKEPNDSADDVQYADENGQKGIEYSGTMQETMPRAAKRMPQKTTSRLRRKAPMGVLPVEIILKDMITMRRPS